MRRPRTEGAMFLRNVPLIISVPVQPPNPGTTCRAEISEIAPDWAESSENALSGGTKHLTNGMT